VFSLIGNTCAPEIVFKGLLKPFLRLHLVSHIMILPSRAPVTKMSINGMKTHFLVQGVSYKIITSNLNFV